MKLTAEVQEQINSMNYQTMLWHRRFDPVGSPWWMGEVGEAMEARLVQLLHETPDEAKVHASKSIGW